MNRQPWIGGWVYDLTLILSPGFLVSATLLCFPGYFREHELTPLTWAVLIVGFDVAHVYSTLYRTYFDPMEFRARRTLYLLVPLFGWLVFAGLYSLGAMVFWRVLAYLAAFHFVRQQYGFMMIYRRDEQATPTLDKAAIYAATLYPLIWWHTHDRAFSWFIEGDFLRLPFPWIANAGMTLYALILASYGAKEILLYRQTGRFNLPRNLILLGTALSWWSSIILLNSDLGFTAANVISHAVPYMALVWLYGRNQARDNGGLPMIGFIPARLMFSAALVPLFLGLPILLAYIEEGLWDGFIWTEHGAVFGLFRVLQPVSDSDILVLLVPLLALPQITHYLLDAVIWRMNLPGTPWKRVIFQMAAESRTE